MEKTLTGKIVGHTEVKHVGDYNKRKVTEFYVRPKNGDALKMSIHGKHDILVYPNMVGLKYETHTGVNWVNRYTIYRRGEPIYSEPSD